MFTCPNDFLDRLVLVYPSSSTMKNTMTPESTPTRMPAAHSTAVKPRNTAHGGQSACADIWSP